jgi:hypothetical protein
MSVMVVATIISTSVIPARILCTPHRCAVIG